MQSSKMSQRLKEGRSKNNLITSPNIGLLWRIQRLFGGVPNNFRDNAVSGGGAIPKELRESP